MPSEKFFVHKEDGSLVRLKGRLVRFLDEEPPTGSDKSAIRTALEVSPDAEGLVQADIGTDPNQLVLHQHLGDISYQSADSVSVDKLEVESTTGTTTTQALTVTDGTDTKFLVREDGRLGVNTASPAQDVHITGADPTIRLQDTSAGGSAEIEALNGSLIIDADIGGQVANSIIALKTDGVEAVRIDSSQRVGIGTSSPGSLSAAANNLVVGSGTGNQGLTVFSGSANEAAIYFADGTAGNQAYRGYVVYQNASDSLVFGSSGTTRWSIDSSGNLVANSTGIDFGSGASTTLDEYEEGYHETTVGTDGTGSITLYASHDRMTYTKIGNIVQINGMFAITSVSSPTGNVTFSLPFSVPTLTDNAGYAGGAVYFQDYGTSNTTAPFRCVPGTSTMTVFVDSSTLAANDKFAFNFTYRTTAS